MNELVKQNQFLKSKYDNLAVDAEEKLGYHWNEVVQNIIFNKFVKPNKQFMKRYLGIKIDLEHHEGKNKSGSVETVNNHPTQIQNTEFPADPTAELEIPYDPAAPLDTRIVQEMDTGDAGNYSYSTPVFGFPGTMAQFKAQWAKKNAASANHDLKIIKTDNEPKTMGVNETKNLINLNELNDLFSDYFEVKDTLSEEKKPDALIQLDRIHAETKKNTLGYMKSVKNQTMTPLVNSPVEDANEVFDKVLNKGDKHKMSNKDIPRHIPTDDENEFVEMSRGGNLLDRVIQGQDKSNPLSPQFKKRMEDEAGKKAVASADKKNKLRNELPKPAMTRVQNLQENVESKSIVIDALYRPNIHRNRIPFIFESKNVIEATHKGENQFPLETMGMGNSPAAIALCESFDFYINATTNEVFKVKKTPSILNESKTVSKQDTARMDKLMGISSKKWIGKR